MTSTLSTLTAMFTSTVSTLPTSPLPTPRPSSNATTAPDTHNRYDLSEHNLDYIRAMETPSPPPPGNPCVFRWLEDSGCEMMSSGCEMMRDRETNTDAEMRDDEAVEVDEIGSDRDEEEEAPGVVAMPQMGVGGCGTGRVIGGGEVIPMPPLVIHTFQAHEGPQAIGITPSGEIIPLNNLSAHYPSPPTTTYIPLTVATAAQINHALMAYHTMLRQRDSVISQLREMVSERGETIRQRGKMIEDMKQHIQDVVASEKEVWKKVKERDIELRYYRRQEALGHVRVGRVFMDEGDGDGIDAGAVC